MVPAGFGAESEQPDSKTVYADVVIYGGTCAGVTAAVQAQKMGRSAVIVSPDRHLGGLSSGGLGATDSGNKKVIGGLAREFYHRIWNHYQEPEAWRWQKPEKYPGRNGTADKPETATDDTRRTMWTFEPHVAEAIFDNWVQIAKTPVYRDHWLDREKGVKVVDGQVQSITTLCGKKFVGKVYIDATYEGDLMAAAGISYHVGRESNAVYGEKSNGVQKNNKTRHHRFLGCKCCGGNSKISPYRVPDDPKSGLLPLISSEPTGEEGEGDKRVQAYCFRVCMSNNPENRIPFPKPKGYDAGQYELLLRTLLAGNRALGIFSNMPNCKTDTNNRGPFSSDNIGRNYDYPDASYERRHEIIEQHKQYQQGLYYFLGNDPRVPEDVRKTFTKWGLAKDEFVESGNWPHQLYIREARRMIGSFVMTENELRFKKPVPQPIGMGSYGMDSHNVQRYVTTEGYVENEGDVETGIPAYRIAYGSIVPKISECKNLLVPVCVSSSHIAYGSIRMEPVFMILGQSASTAAILALEQAEKKAEPVSVQSVDYTRLRERLLADGQVL
ncbi:MAG: FAD-dependent oxidoreductase [Kiritimatiellae bacterium]|nr:FAD-dependent oxidoreductase [Kiritimatiellia bacterium]MDD5521775.1 FAD-dependent oxidoreductase [Kiritimatiellia bacterium]